VLFLNVNDPGRIAYQSNSTFGPVQCATCTATFPSVPTNHRLVIQHISIGVYSVTPSPIIVSLLLEPDGISLANNSSNVNFTPASRSPLTYSNGSVDLPTLAFIDGGKIPQVALTLLSGQLTSSGPTSGVTLSGYMVDCMIAPCAAIAH
jgi:hypothetical protein